MQKKKKTARLTPHMTQHCLVQLGRLPTFMTCGPCPSINPGPHNSPARPCRRRRGSRGHPRHCAITLPSERSTPTPTATLHLGARGSQSYMSVTSYPHPIQTARGICICSCEVLSFTVNIYILPACYYQTTIFSFSVRAHLVSRESLPGINPT